MGNQVRGSGTLTASSTVEQAALEALRAHPRFRWGVREGADLGDVLRYAFGFTTAEPTTTADGERTWQVTYSDGWSLDVPAGMDVLATAGVRGGIEFVDQDGHRCKLSLYEGTCRQLEAVVSVYPRDPDPDAPCMALTGNEVSALLAQIVAGRPGPAGDQVLARLMTAPG